MWFVGVGLGLGLFWTGGGVVGVYPSRLQSRGGAVWGAIGGSGERELSVAEMMGRMAR